MAVAAADQTLGSAIAFWRGVSSGDHPRGDLTAYAPLGLPLFTEAVDLAASRSGWDKKEPAEGEEGPAVVLGSWSSVRMQYLRRIPAALRASVNAAAIARRIFEEEEEMVVGDGRGLWRQPDVLLEGSAVNRSARRGTPRVRQSSQSLMAVLYISLEGMVYPVRMADVDSLVGLFFEASADPSHTETHREEDMGEEFATDAETTQFVKAYNGWVLPFDEDDSFTRGALGL
ncbi:unnamed protein product [Phytomonas sp. Hart1]|nr:unnamed protein product [Phytomonas sp. Hart1]|eukprot:CCW67442.1 unnamed protein product [Phytomonas sp. isolate Hart1]